MEGLGAFRVEEFHTCIGHTGKSAAQSKILPSEKVLLCVLQTLRKIIQHPQYRGLADIAVRFSLFVHMNLGVTHFPGIFCIDTRPFQRLRIEQHGMSAAGLHDKDLIGADFVQIRFAHVFLRFIPPGSHIKGAIWILGNEVLDDLAVFDIIGQPYLCQVCLSHKAVTGKIWVAVGLQETGIDKVFTVIQHLGICAGKLPCFLSAAYIGKYAVLYICSLGKGALFIHRDDVAKNK